jgi:DNA-directed RNA polymerase specialized sigma24 family protein
MSTNDGFEADDGVRDSDKRIDIEKILEEMLGQIKHMASKNLPRSRVYEGAEALESDELAQCTLIKLWEALQKRDIAHYWGYARRIIFNASTDMARRYRPLSSLPLNEQGELKQGQFLFTPSEIMEDPARQVERRDTLTEYLSAIVEDVLGLPPQQRRAMICELKDQIADLLPIAEAFLQRGVDIRPIHWSHDLGELRSQRVSLAIARKKLRAHRKRYFSL